MPGMPRPVTDERDGLMAFLAQQRDLLRTAAHGLTDEQARSTPTASSLSVGGLIKHAAAIERGWMVDVRGEGGDIDMEAAEASYGDDMVMGPDETLAALVADLDAAAAETEALVAGLPMDHPVPVPDLPWFPDDVEAWSLRFVLLHLIEEHARHAGHADIIREHVDGATWYALMTAREGTDLGPYVTPWEPAAS